MTPTETPGEKANKEARMLIAEMAASLAVVSICESLAVALKDVGQQYHEEFVQLHDEMQRRFPQNKET